jgi:2-oxoacid:acceptor oxidoreductase delta subunit (pyruvate/2-ketoisovalerate family)
MKKFKSHKDLPAMAVSCEPTSVNKTGGWRALTPVIDYSRCIGCTICWKFCPEICVTLDEKPRIILEYCKGCGICAFECPKKAITMK